MFNFLIKFLILFCLILEIHSWNWGDYPSPRASTYFKCGIQNRSFVCDPDAMLTDQQRKEIILLVENFKEKTKRVSLFSRQFQFYSQIQQFHV
ncbi:unnamed protein product [Meloidogyne enterolobii]|uniref:Uncharacterized protein n=1 Tax=Meloidogyne enterolobii TaxID=390850 RepID=A0ACB1A1C7_MELEN